MPTPISIPRITLIGIYFGRLPFYAPLFFKSAGANPAIDFLIVADRYPPCPLPANVRLLLINRTAFERLASEKIGHAMQLRSPRKLCDYKPAYGRIFSDYLRRADFWGHIDFDIVWGDMARFLHPAIAQGHEVISGDGKRISGPCTIYKNTHRVRELFREVPDVIDKLNSAESFDLDERAFDGVVKASELRLLNCSFYTRRDISFEELRRFLGRFEASDALYRRILDGHALTATTGRRLPALWREGELWSCLPCGKAGHVWLLNCMFLHLTTAKVSFTIDFSNDLILPRSGPRSGPRKKLRQTANPAATLLPSVL
jgi:hypothetical protein